MTMPFALYMAAWMAAGFAAAYLIARHRQRLELCHARYWRFLLQDWKVLSFSIAVAGLTVVAPYSDDYTWDLRRRAGDVRTGIRYESLGSWHPESYAAPALLVGQRVHRALRLAVLGELVLRSVYRAERRLVLALLAANLFLSSILYICAGLFWAWVAADRVCCSVHPTHCRARCR
jgi:hypothetical protein